MKFNVGDRVRIDCPDSRAHGQETVVTRLEVTGQSQGKSYVGNEVDILVIDCLGVYAIFEDHELIPIYDGHEVAAWEDCIFKPQVLERI